MDVRALTIEAVRDGPVCTLLLRGDLDLSAASGFVTQAALVIDDWTRRLVLDLAEVTFLDCTGVRTLRMATTFAPSGCPVIIRSLSPMARRILELLDPDLANLQELSRWRPFAPDSDFAVEVPGRPPQAPGATARQAGDRPGQAGAVAFVFQGGGSFTAPQAGMLRALREADLTLPRGPLPLAYHAVGQMLGAVARGDLAAARGPVHVLPAPSSQAVSPVDFRDTSRLIDEGYRLATDWLATHMAPAATGTQTGPSGSYLRRAVSAFLAEVPGSEVVAARLRPGSAR
jgi:anti-anti-sigma factor